MPVRKAPSIVGLTGPIGSGVTTVSEMLAGKGFHRLSLSAPIKATVLAAKNLDSKTDIKTLPEWRRELQDAGDAGRAQSPTHWLDQALAQLPDGANIVIDGIRNVGEVEGLRNQFPAFYLVAVVADKAVRWERVKAVYQNDSARFERDDERDSEDKDDRPNGQQVGRCVNEADYVFLNNGNAPVSREVRNKRLEEQLWTDVELMLGQKSRDPYDHEVHMAEAYTLSHRSRCLKRYVGAVIVGTNGLHLSAGFNENPVGMKPCVVEFGTCFKDDLMHKELEELPHVFCPACGQKNSQLKKPWLCSNPSCRKNLKAALYPSRNMEKCTALHAEERAIRSLPGGRAPDATMYVTTYPCLQCARYIVDAEIRKVVYVEAYPVKESAHYLKINDVQVEPFQGFKARAFNLIFRPVT